MDRAIVCLVRVLRRPEHLRVLGDAMEESDIDSGGPLVRLRRFSLRTLQ